MKKYLLMIFAGFVLFASRSIGCDKGIGIVYFKGDYTRELVPETLIIRDGKQREANVIARFFRGASLVYHFLTDSGEIEGNILMFDQEISGIPIQKLSSDKKHIQVIYDCTNNKRMKTGWIKNDSTKIGFLLLERYSKI